MYKNVVIKTEEGFGTLYPIVVCNEDVVPPSEIIGWQIKAETEDQVFDFEDIYLNDEDERDLFKTTMSILGSKVMKENKHLFNHCMILLKSGGLLSSSMRHVFFSDDKPSIAEVKFPDKNMILNSNNMMDAIIQSIEGTKKDCAAMLCLLGQIPIEIFPQTIDFDTELSNSIITKNLWNDKDDTEPCKFWFIDFWKKRIQNPSLEWKISHRVFCNSVHSCIDAL